MNALLLYPDKPFGLGDLTAFVYNPETQERERILISSTPDLDAHIAYAKERRLVDEVKFELSQGRQVPDICRLHRQARCDPAAKGAVGAGRNPG